MHPIKLFLRVFLLTLALGQSALANLPGGGTGTGPDVTLVNNGDGTVTMANGILAIVITTGNATIQKIYYTYNNSGATVTNQVLAGGYDGGEFYWENAGFGSGAFTYSVVANNGNYCEVDLSSASSTNGVMDVRFSMLRGSPGYYVTPTWSHRAGDGAMTSVEGRDNIYVGSSFNWMSVSAQHDFETGVNQPLVPAFISPQENELVTGGPLEGTYFDKYKYGMDFGGENAGQRVWGWSSVSDPAIGFAGQNIGLWHVLASVEVYNGGPMKTELMEGESAYSLNMINGGHYGMGQALTLTNNEIWSHTYGPYFIYFNNLTNTLTDPVQASRALFADAQAQAAAEKTAWPYAWFTNANYGSAPQRGTVSGQLMINDAFNPNASASNLWVGVVQQPQVDDGIYDFQQWAKPYQFWAKSGADGSFAISNVIAGSNYTLYAFGPGAAGTFMSQNQTGGAPPWLFNLPAAPFSVTVTGGTTNQLGAVNWTPTRVGPTVFEIGYPDRTSGKFRHGDDWFTGDIGPGPTAPSPIWTKFLDYPFDFPNGVNYVVGQSRWSTDWNFIQPEVIDLAGNFNASSSTITFTLASAPGSATASLYLAFAGAFSGPTIVSVNGNNLGNESGVTATPVSPLTSTGFNPALSQSDVSVREGNHGAFSDERITFPGSLLKAGQNTINLQMRKVNSSESHIMYDYVRLELTGYVPPAPAGVTAYPGNGCNLVCWPVAPGATSYNLFRSTTRGAGYVPLTNGVTGPVCGSGPANATYVDASAANGTAYYYAVQSVNPVGNSTNSLASTAATPSAGLSAGAPATPVGLAATIVNGAVTLNWNAVPGANFYIVERGTVVNLPTGYVPFYVVLSNTTTNSTYTDASGTLGCTYGYTVTAAGAGGVSAATTPVFAKPLPLPPAAPPAKVRISDNVTSTNQSPTISWSPVSGAVGYILFRSTNPTGPFSFPANYVMSVTTTNWTDSGLAANALYTYEVVAMNAAGISGNSAIVSTPPPAPASLTAYAGNAQITLVWPAAAGATNYVILRGNSSGNETTTVASTASTTCTDTNLLNGSAYYYVVIAYSSGGASLRSPEASATPFAGPPAVYWTNTLTSPAQNWNVNSNWSNGAFPNGAQSAAILTAAIGANQTINLNQAITVGALSCGVSGGAFNVAGNGGALTFDNTPGQASLLQLSASSGDTLAAPITVNGGLLVTNASANPFTVAGNLSGAASGITVNGGVIFAGTNNYTGGTVVNGGNLTFAIGSAIPTGGTLTLNNNGSVTVSAASALPNVLVNGTNFITGNGNSGTAITTLNDAGTLTLSVVGGSEVFDLTGPMTGAGTLVLGSSPMTLRFNGTAGDASAIFNLGSGTAVADVRSTGTTALALGGLSGGPGTQLQGDNSGGANLTYTIGGADANTEFDGLIKDGNNGAVTATVALVKTGAGILTLANANTYSGGTTINGGSLQINNSAGSGSGSGAVIVASGGTLGGVGMISGPVAVNAGGAFAPGNPLGVLTLSNSLTLEAGSTTLIQIQAAPATNSGATILGALTEGGTLSVTNAGGAPAGGRFQLFNASRYLGAFGGFSLPLLAAGLAWDTTRLNLDGSLGVVSLNPPVFKGFSVSGNQLSLSGTGGTPSWYYSVLASTNLLLPVGSWTRWQTNQFDGAGNFSCTNLIGAGAPPLFFRLEVQ